jgi:hypothetical protein
VGLLKVREGKYKRGHGGAQVESGGRERASLPQVLLKLMLTYARGEPGDSYPIINEWGQAWVIPGPGEGIGAIPEPGHGRSEMQYEVIYFL